MTDYPIAPFSAHEKTRLPYYRIHGTELNILYGIRERIHNDEFENL